MKSRTRIGLLGLSLSFTTLLSIIGSTAATIAWYANSTGVKISYSGTSISKSVQIILGIVDEENKFSESELSTYNLYKEDASECDGKNIVWSKSSSVVKDVIEAYLTKYGHATNLLAPVTSKARAIDSTSGLTLYKSPESQQVHLDETAEKKSYIKIPFAFKIVDSDSHKVSNKEIWLTHVMTDTDPAGNEGNKSLRMFVDNSREKYILRPADNSLTTGATTVGGLLNIDGDDNNYYDYDATTKREFIYGDYDHSVEPVYSEEVYAADEVENVNHTPYTEGFSTFYAKHHEGVHKISNYEDLIFEKAEYQTFGTVKPDVDGSIYSGGKPIAYTDSASKIGYSTISIYIEGWDHSLTDDKEGVKFNLGLTFEINRIN